jgi:hypothetical protein
MFGFSSFAETPFASLAVRSTDVVVTVTGVSATALVGNVTVSIPVTVPVTGVYATTYLGIVNVWGIIIPIQNPNWVPVDDTQSGGWTPVSTLQTSNWVLVDDAQSGSWTPIPTPQTPNWTDIAA